MTESSGYLNLLFRLEVGRLRMLVRQLTQFVTIRQFPPADRTLPPLSKSKWWIPAAARVLALLSNKQKLNEFYI